MFLKKKNFFNGSEDFSNNENLEVKEDILDIEDEIDFASKSDEVYKNLNHKGSDIDLSINDAVLSRYIQQLENSCKQANRKDLLQQLSDLKQYLTSSKFTVAVVGEFNRGKSTLVNHLTDMDMIPTSIIPTTATLIHVSGSKKEEIIVRSRKKEKKYPFSVKSWDPIEDLVQESDKSICQIYIHRNCPFLTENEIELIDTPGVNSQIDGDLTIAERAISECDCAILPMDATAPFSISETFFLQEHLLMKKIPRIMVVLTKMDLVEKEQRARVVELVQKKLSMINDAIPVYISAENLVDEWEDRSGVKAIQKQLLQWLNESQHIELKKERAADVLHAIATDLITVYQYQLDVIAEKNDQRKAVIETKKKQLIADSQIQWDTLEIEMLNRSTRNFDWIRNMVDERQETIIEKLEIELSHVNMPKDWWERDYPYRIKMEMISIGNMLENNLQNFYNRDVNWLNNQLKEKYGVSVPASSQRIADKEIFRNPMLHSQESIELEDVKKARMISRVGSGALTVAGYAVGGLLGFSPIGMAVGLGSGIVSEVFMNKRIEAQKVRLTAMIRENLPRIIEQCIQDVEANIRNYYIETINVMRDSCAEWVKVKKEAIDAALQKGSDPKAEQEINSKIKELRNIEKYKR